MKSQLGYYYLRKNGEIVYAHTLLKFLYHRQRTSLLEFFTTTDRSKLESIIDTTYSNYILEECNILDKGADFKFNTIRNVFRYRFRTKDYMINHYSHKLSLPIIKILKHEFADKDVLNIVMPAKINVMAIIREFGNGIYEYANREYNLVRAGPYSIRSPLVA